MAPMKYVIIRSDKTDKFTMHAITCQVAVKHYGDKMIARISENAPETTVQCMAEMAQYADECGWNECPKVKICKCAK
jgi:hypothetical protein